MFKISLNKELDYEVYRDFKDFSAAGVDFGGKIRKEHPGINSENCQEYIDDYYATNRVAMDEKLNQINKLVSEKQSIFYSALSGIFHTDFRPYLYQGYLSIFDCNPRWPETGTFQIFYKKELPYMLEVAFHETLHFAFFDYLDKNFSEQTKKLSKNSGILWEMSEIFNVIILNLSPFREILGMEELLFYPELKEKLDKAKEIWSLNNGNISMFVRDYLKKV